MIGDNVSILLEMSIYHFSCHRVKGTASDTYYAMQILALAPKAGNYVLLIKYIMCRIIYKYSRFEWLLSGRLRRTYYMQIWCSITQLRDRMIIDEILFSDVPNIFQHKLETTSCQHLFTLYLLLQCNLNSQPLPISV